MMPSHAAQSGTDPDRRARLEGSASGIVASGFGRVTFTTVDVRARAGPAIGSRVGARFHRRGHGTAGACSAPGTCSNARACSAARATAASARIWQPRAPDAGIARGARVDGARVHVRSRVETPHGP